MKRITKIVMTLILVILIPEGILNAQGKQEEKRIKIVVDDKSGARVEIDTLIKGASPDSIKLKNGEVIFLAKDGPEGTIKHVKGEKGQMFVTVNSDDKGDKKMKKQITMRLDEETVDYFKKLAATYGMPYQNLINLYLRECAHLHKKLIFKWAA